MNSYKGSQNYIDTLSNVEMSNKPNVEIQEYKNEKS